MYVRVAPFAPAVPLPITINGITFEGRARCIITLLPQQPFVEQVEVAMVTMPKVGFKVRAMPLELGVALTPLPLPVMAPKTRRRSPRWARWTS